MAAILMGMELNQDQLRTIGALATAFCHGVIQDADITLVYDAPTPWARVHIIPYYFLVDHEGMVQHVSERSSPPPGYPSARRVA